MSHAYQDGHYLIENMGSEQALIRAEKDWQDYARKPDCDETYSRHLYAIFCYIKGYVEGSLGTK